jgi:hypothetical protein
MSSAPSLRTREATLLWRDLALHTTVKRLLTRHRITLKLAALGPGRLAFAWAIKPIGSRTRHPLVIAVAVKTKRAGTVHLTLHLKAAAMHMLRHARHGLTVAGSAAFVPRHGRTVKVRRSFRVAA